MMFSKNSPRRPIYMVMQKLTLLLLISVVYLFSVMPVHLSACAMSALIAIDGHTLDEFPRQGQAGVYWEYNDPWDYFGFVMANSAEYSNADGYGIVAYRAGDPRLAPRGMWYKRVYELDDFGTQYYTGQYLSYDPTSTDWEHDVFDDALFTVMGGTDHPGIVLCHARFASGITYGNHPFWFQYRNRTFTFMHNGNVNVARSFMIERIHAMNPGGEWFIQHSSNHFAQTDPEYWVDTEVLFHYLMNYIIAARGDVVQGINNGLVALGTLLTATHNGVYNFIMSDGSKLYAFRSTPLTGPYSSYRLSYREFKDQFYGIRTQAPLPEDVVLNRNELVVFSHEDKPRHYPNIALQDFANVGPQMHQQINRDKKEEIPPAVSASPNPFSLSTDLRINAEIPGILHYEIFNLKGERIWSATQEVPLAGIVGLSWNATDVHGRPVPGGIYLLRATLGSFIHTKRLVLVK